MAPKIQNQINLFEDSPIIILPTFMVPNVIDIPQIEDTEQSSNDTSMEQMIHDLLNEHFEDISLGQTMDEDESSILNDDTVNYLRDLWVDQHLMDEILENDAEIDVDAQIRRAQRYIDAFNYMFEGNDVDEQPDDAADDGSK